MRIPLPLVFTFCVIFSFIGFLAGKGMSNTAVMSAGMNSASGLGDKTTDDVVFKPNEALDAGKEMPLSNARGGNTPLNFWRINGEMVENLEKVLTSETSDEAVMLQILFYLWAQDKVLNHQNQIAKIPQFKKSHRVKNLAQWILSEAKNNESNEMIDAMEWDMHSGTDLDQQIQASLLDDYEQVTQDEDQLHLEYDLAEPLYAMPESEQKDYIDGLVQSHDDAAVEALTHLILDERIEIQTAAIDGLITLLENKTGHSQQVLAALDFNSSFLSDQQLSKVESLRAGSEFP